MTTLATILEDEGFEPRPYTDTLGNLTFGHGLTYITEEESEAIAQGRVYNLFNLLNHEYDWFFTLTGNRQTVIVSMAYQMGLTGFSKFVNTIKFIDEKKYYEASVEMLDSRWALQTPERAMRLSELFAAG